MITFQGKIRKDEGGKLIYIELPFDAKKKYNQTKSTIHVFGTMNKIPYRMKLLSRGKGTYFLVLSKELQKQLGYQEKEMNVEVIIELDDGIMEEAVVEEIEQKETTIDVLTAIQKRRSIRKFEKKALSKDELTTILNAGFCAPSGMNKRPWHFIVVQKKKDLAKLAEVNSHAKMVKDCAAAIIVCGDQAVQSNKELFYADCFAATQNILLSSYGLGIGSVWTAVLANSDIRKYIIETYQLPVKTIPVAMIALGYPAEEKEEVNRFEKAKIHYDKW